MNISDPKIKSLRENVRAAQHGFYMAVTFYAAWKTSRHDADLRERMAVSYATTVFHVVRVALRREMLLALMRLWDKIPGAIRMDSIAETLRDKRVIDALAADRANRIG